eukprot:jgi/Galph1/2397/GphlegSOOS_G1061.1
MEDDDPLKKLGTLNKKRKSTMKRNKVSYLEETEEVSSEENEDRLSLETAKKEDFKRDESYMPFRFNTKSNNKTTSQLSYQANQSAVQSGPQDQRATLGEEVLEEEPANKKKSIFGPQRAPSHIRMSVRFDFQPDVCKDYKETGYCGFGDACKFLHDRSNYKSGWELEKEWEEQQQKRQQPKETDIQETKEKKEELPFACFICRNKFRSPIVTLCGHYFCEECALRYHRQNNGKCAVCSKATKGVFNTAWKLLQKDNVQSAN